MNQTVHIRFGMVDYGPLKVGGVVAAPFVRNQLGTAFDVVMGDAAQDFASAFLYDLCLDSASALNHANYNSLRHSSNRPSAKPCPLWPLGLVHVLDLTADECFIHLNRSGKKPRVASHSFANPMQHEPCAFLSDAKSTGNFAGTNSIPAIADDPESAHPFIQTERGILKDCSDFERELLLASLAEPDSPCADKRVFLRSAARARNHAIR